MSWRAEAAGRCSISHIYSEEALSQDLVFSFPSKWRVNQSQFHPTSFLLGMSIFCPNKIKQVSGTWERDPLGRSIIGYAGSGAIFLVSLGLTGVLALEEAGLGMKGRKKRLGYD